MHCSWSHAHFWPDWVHRCTDRLTRHDTSSWMQTWLRRRFQNSMWRTISCRIVQERQIQLFFSFPLGHYLYGIHHIDIFFEGWCTNKYLEVDIGYNIQLPNALNWIQSYKIVASFVQNRRMQNNLKRNTNHKCIIYQFVFMACTRYTTLM